MPNGEWSSMDDVSLLGVPLRLGVECERDNECECPENGIRGDLDAEVLRTGEFVRFCEPGFLDMSLSMLFNNSSSWPALYDSRQEPNEEAELVLGNRLGSRSGEDGIWGSELRSRITFLPLDVVG